MDILFMCLDLIGVISFAISGAMTGIRKNMDVFGVCVMGLTTATGGGIVRDVLLGITPPTSLKDPRYIIVAIAVSIVVFFPAVRRRLLSNGRIYELLMLITDSAGLGIFTISGVKLAIETGYGESWFILVFVGLITGVGGGVLRDVFAGDRPYIFVKHIYACASIIGAVCCIFIWEYSSETAMIAGIAAIMSIRFLAAHFKWSLPKAMDVLK